MVVRHGLIFKAGNYPQNGRSPALSMTPDEVKAMAANFKPVPVDLNHKTTLKGIDEELGQVTAVTADESGRMFARLEIPEWLNNLVGKDKKTGKPIPIKVSSTILTKSKRLAKVALTDDPVISDAAVFAAFSQAHPEKAAQIEAVDLSEVADSDEEEVTVFADGEVVEFAPRKKFKTYDGQSVLQSLHDIAARSGAVCSPNEPTAEFHSSQELASIQSMHDTAVAGGAVCRVLKDGQVAMPACFSESTKEIEMSQENVQVAKANEASAIELIGKMFAHFSGQPKTEAAPATPANPVVPAPASTTAASATVELSQEAKDKIEKLEADLAAANAAAEEAKTATAAAFETTVSTQAARFADEVIQRGAEIPANRDACVAAFAQAIRDDASNQVQATFGKDKEGKEVKGGRVDILNAMYATRKPLELTQEQLDEQATTALLSNDGGNKNIVNGIDIEKVKERARKHAESLRRKNAR